MRHYGAFLYRASFSEWWDFGGFHALSGPRAVMQGPLSFTTQGLRYCYVFFLALGSPSPCKKQTLTLAKVNAVKNKRAIAQNNVMTGVDFVPRSMIQVFRGLLEDFLFSPQPPTYVTFSLFCSSGYGSPPKWRQAALGVQPNRGEQGAAAASKAAPPMPAAFHACSMALF